MPSSPIISVKNIGKKYKLGATLGGRNYKTLRDLLTQIAFSPFRKLSAAFRKEPSTDGSHLSINNPITQSHNNLTTKSPNNPKEFWALKDISFDVQQGEVVGIIGANGAGKSTLLKILCEITEPTEGEIRIRGRVASLLEVGTGFHPELSGRENIFMNGAILGMTKSEIIAKFDEIVAFAEVEKFIDTPVKRYSSGMYVRLAFAVAAHLEPEILLVDEVLAVGDVAFQKKCLGKMEDVSQKGRTVLFVSHNMGAVQRLCGRSILLESGSIVKNGQTSSVISTYLNINSSEAKAEVCFPADPKKGIQIRRLAVVDNELNVKSEFDVFEQVTVIVEYEVRKELVGSNVMLLLSREGIDLFTSFDTDDNSEYLDKRLPGYYKAIVKLPCPIKGGSYSVHAGTGIVNLTAIESARDLDPISFEINEESFDPTFVGYARKRLGIMAAHLSWEKAEF